MIVICDFCRALSWYAPGRVRSESFSIDHRKIETKAVNSKSISIIIRKIREASENLANKQANYLKSGKTRPT